MFYKILAAIKLSRPGNVAITGLSVLVGTSGYGLKAHAWGIILAVVSAMLIASGGNSLNDFYDYEIDKINRSQRPLPAGLLQPKTAVYLGSAWMLLGLALACFIGVRPLALALAVSVLLWLYAARGKRMGLAGNLTVALVCGLAFVYGGLTVGNIGLSWFPAGFAFLMHLSREIIKDVQDRSGDLSQGAKTLPIAWGAQRSLKLAAATLMVLITLTPVPYLLGIYNTRYLLAVILGVDLMLGIMIVKLLTSPRDEDLGRISFFIKIVMLVGIMAICLGL
ncbi:geranylgeranylglycerol-phosphate geranylgeranyltransferase [candidate division TA06 bacterium]|uniref:Geranylgeranylglycerol-phosphate geranylgeranyltransferase n=1 Tax=candidate division TA06 bacterium TaxID=2250710 RepID=A0A933ICC4_UNCT6|nr:geranylgeranylglycerol-phosphate geranylgeranyltransferase [candidate division TA06 bacterium]